MDLLKSYRGNSSSSDEDEEEASMSMPGSSSAVRTLCLPSVNLAPQVVEQRTLQQVALIDPKTKELYHNPRYEELFQPEVF